MKRPGVDLATDSDEQHYAAQYIHWLTPLLGSQKTVLDVGCGAGRLTATVARALPEATVVGIDLSPGKLAYARTHLRDLTNVELVEADCVSHLAGLPPSSVDLVLFTEVEFFTRSEGMIGAVARVIRPGGLLFGSFRSEWFNLVHSVRNRDFASARTVRDERAGELWDTSYLFHWHRPDELVQELARADLTVEGCYGVGVLSGREGDPFDRLARPSTLSDADRGALLELELSLAEDYAACGRYILAVARKGRTASM